MGEVIEVDFLNCKDGYILNGRKVEGVYMGDLAATLMDDGDCAIGFKDDDGITGQKISLEDLNRFCFMWLCIFDESVIVKEDENDE